DLSARVPRARGHVWKGSATPDDSISSSRQSKIARVKWPTPWPCTTAPSSAAAPCDSENACFSPPIRNLQLKTAAQPPHLRHRPGPLRSAPVGLDHLGPPAMLRRQEAPDETEPVVFAPADKRTRHPVPRTSCSCSYTRSQTQTWP